MKRLILIFLFLTSCLLSAQHKSKLSRELKHLNELSSYTVAADINFADHESYGFTDKGSLVAISENRSLVCYGSNGQVEWQRSLASPAIKTSVDGKKILISYAGTEYSVVEMLNSNGQILWSKRTQGQHATLFTPSGNYLYPFYDQDSPLPLRVFDSMTGNFVWEDPAQRISSIRAIAALNDESLAIVNQASTLQLLDMATGRVVTESYLGKEFEGSLSHTRWGLAVSADGQRLTVLGRTSYPEKKTLIRTYDAGLQIKWGKLLKPGGYDLLAGLSEDGSKLFVTRPNSVNLYNNSSGDLIWKVEGRFRNNGSIVSNNFISLLQVGAESEVFILGDNGRLTKRLTTKSAFLKSLARIIEIGPFNNQNTVLILGESKDENEE